MRYTKTGDPDRQLWASGLQHGQDYSGLPSYALTHSKNGRIANDLYSARGRHVHSSTIASVRHVRVESIGRKFCVNRHGTVPYVSLRSRHLYMNDDHIGDLRFSLRFVTKDVDVDSNVRLRVESFGADHNLRLGFIQDSGRKSINTLYNGSLRHKAWNVRLTNDIGTAFDHGLLTALQSRTGLVKGGLSDSDGSVEVIYRLRIRTHNRHLARNMSIYVLSITTILTRIGNGTVYANAFRGTHGLERIEVVRTTDLSGHHNVISVSAGFSTNR